MKMEVCKYPCYFLFISYGPLSTMTGWNKRNVTFQTGRNKRNVMFQRKVKLLRHPYLESKLTSENFFL